MIYASYDLYPAWQPVRREHNWLHVTRWMQPAINTVRCATAMGEGLYHDGPNIVSIRSDVDIVAARIAARDVARRLGFGTLDQARIATVTSELTRNMLSYAGEGDVIITPISRPTEKHQHGIEIVFRDQGPGIVEADFILEHGNTSTGKRVHGLPGAQRLMDELQIETNNGSGTRIVCRKWLR